MRFVLIGTTVLSNDDVMTRSSLDLDAIWIIAVRRSSVLPLNVLYCFEDLGGQTSSPVHERQTPTCVEPATILPAYIAPTFPPPPVGFLERRPIGHRGSGATDLRDANEEEPLLLRPSRGMAVRQGERDRRLPNGSYPENFFEFSPGIVRFARPLADTALETLH